MPVMPTFTADTNYGGPPALAEMDPREAARGAEALARGAAGASDEFMGFAAQYAQQKRAIAASDTMMGVENRLGEAAVRWSRVADMEKAVDGFNTEATQIRKDTVAGIPDVQVQNLVADRFNHAQITHSWNVRQQSFGMEASAARGNLDTQLAQLAGQAATAPTAEQRAQAMDDATRAIASRSPLYLAPEEAAKEQLKFRSNVDKVQALDYIKRASQAPDITRLSPLEISNNILDPKNFPNLLPTERQGLADQAIRLGRTIVSMRMAEDAHNETVAHKELTARQAGNAAGLIASIATATPEQAQSPDPLKLADMVRSQQLSESGMTAILAAQTRKVAGQDDGPTAADLWRRQRRGEDVSDDALQAYGAGKLKDTTMQEMVKASGLRETGGETAVDKANFATLKTALNGYAIEQGLFAGQSKQEKAELWTQAQTEWTRRVLGDGKGGNKESSVAVLQDMLGRYVKHAATPEGLPAPRQGQVNSLADVAAVWAKTKAAHDAGQMNDAMYSAEAQLLNQYRQAYEEAARASAARAAAKPGAKGKGKAEPVGPSADFEP